MNGVSKKYLALVLAPLVLGVVITIVGILLLAGAFGTSSGAFILVAVGVCLIGVSVLLFFYHKIMIKQRASEGQYQEAKLRYEAMQEMYDKMTKENAAE